MLLPDWSGWLSAVEQQRQTVPAIATLVRAEAGSWWGEQVARSGSARDLEALSQVAGGHGHVLFRPGFEPGAFCCIQSPHHPGRDTQDQ